MTEKKLAESFLKHPRGKAAFFVLKKLKESHFESYFVGGCVRDGLLGIEIKDFDIATKASPDEIKKIFPRFKSQGEKYGTIGVFYKSFYIEVTTFRTEGSYSDKRHPDHVIFSTVEKDSLRRDFTVNAIYFDPLEMKIVDLVKGRESLKKREIKCIGEAKERLSEDCLRMLRAIRFFVTLDFSVDKDIINYIKAHPSHILNTPFQRCYNEWILIFNSKKNNEGIKALIQTHLFLVLFPFAKKFISLFEKIKLKEEIAGSTYLSLMAFFSDFNFPLLKKYLVSKKLLSTVKKNCHYLNFFIKARSEGERQYLIKTYPPLKECLLLYTEMTKKSLFFDFKSIPEPLITIKDLKELKISNKKFSFFLKESYIWQLNHPQASQTDIKMWIKTKS